MEVNNQVISGYIKQLEDNLSMARTGFEESVELGDTLNNKLFEGKMAAFKIALERFNRDFPKLNCGY